jgi:hypothetical protein
VAASSRACSRFQSDEGLLEILKQGLTRMSHHRQMLGVARSSRSAATRSGRPLFGYFRSDLNSVYSPHHVISSPPIVSELRAPR